MLHLQADRLIELGDSEPTNVELAHLGACAECERERQAYRALRGLAVAEGAQVSAPLTSWDALSTALKEEGLIARKPSPVLVLTPPPMRAASRPAPRKRQASEWALRAAAALFFLAGGVVIGRGTPVDGESGSHAAQSAADAAAVPTDAPVGLASNFSGS
ncbi:MAG: hypothetical protein ACR2L6_07120, partial [Gemmatimonadaceae bacterium]